METFSVRPVGWVRAGRDDPADTDHWGDMESTIVLEERFGDECLAGLADFSHVDVVVGTPVLDVKPVMREFLARDVRQPAWVGALMGEYFQP